MLATAHDSRGAIAPIGFKCGGLKGDKLGILHVQSGFVIEAKRAVVKVGGADRYLKVINRRDLALKHTG